MTFLKYFLLSKLLTSMFFWNFSCLHSSTSGRFCMFTIWEIHPTRLRTESRIHPTKFGTRPILLRWTVFNIEQSASPLERISRFFSFDQRLQTIKDIVVAKYILRGANYEINDGSKFSAWFSKTGYDLPHLKADKLSDAELDQVIQQNFGRIALTKYSASLAGRALSWTAKISFVYLIYSLYSVQTYFNDLGQFQTDLDARQAQQVERIIEHSLDLSPKEVVQALNEQEWHDPKLKDLVHSLAQQNEKAAK